MACQMANLFIAASQEGEGLGAKGSGISAPVGATGAAGYSTLGLGAAEVGAPAEGADSFEVYRARMMLGYVRSPMELLTCLEAWPRSSVLFFDFFI